MIINRVLKANIVYLYCVHMREIFWSEMKISFVLFMLITRIYIYVALDVQKNTEMFHFS